MEISYRFQLKVYRPRKSIEILFLRFISPFIQIHSDRPLYTAISIRKGKIIMTILEAITARHSVRTYMDKPIPEEIIKELNNEIDVCNTEGNLNIQLVTDEPKAFDGFMAHYGKFFGLKNYIALVGKKVTILKKNSVITANASQSKRKCSV